MMRRGDILVDSCSKEYRVSRVVNSTKLVVGDPKWRRMMNFLWSKLINWFDQTSSFFMGRIWARVIWVFGGVSVYDTFSLDASLARWLLPRLKLFRKVKMLHPGEMTEEQCDEILKKIELSMCSIINEVKYGIKPYADKEGCELLGKHLRSLWW